MSLYQIKDTYNILLAALDDDQSESMQDAVANAFEQLGGELKEHAEELGKWLANQDAMILGASAEIERLKSIVASRKNAQARLKSALRDVMVLSDTRKIDTELFVFSLRKGAQSVEVIDAAKLGDEYVTVKVTEAPDKAAIKKGIEAGLIADDIAKLVRGPDSLIIK